MCSSSFGDFHPLTRLTLSIRLFKSGTMIHTEPKLVGASGMVPIVRNTPSRGAFLKTRLICNITAPCHSSACCSALKMRSKSINKEQMMLTLDYSIIMGEREENG